LILKSLDVGLDELTTRTGWSVKPQGACKGEVCVPLPAGAVTAAGTIDARVLADRLGMPLVADDAHSVWALGPETAITGRALTTAVAPDILLPDLQGRDLRIADLRPQKVVLVAWASW
jgi:hypothetical protein